MVLGTFEFERCHSTCPWASHYPSTVLSCPQPKLSRGCPLPLCIPIRRFANRTQADTDLGTITCKHTHAHTLAHTQLTQASPGADGHSGMSRIHPHGQHHRNFQTPVILVSAQAHCWTPRNENHGKDRGCLWALRAAGWCSEKGKQIAGMGMSLESQDTGSAQGEGVV